VKKRFFTAALSELGGELRRAQTAAFNRFQRGAECSSAKPRALDQILPLKKFF